MTDDLCHLVADANEVVRFKLVRSVQDIEDDGTTFGPEMCHQVFGENEKIFGYSNLVIKLYYSAGSLRTYLSIEYKQKLALSKSDTLKADDIEKPLQKILAPGYHTSLDEFISKLEEEKSFKPHGRLIEVFSSTPRDGGATRTFEVYYSEPNTPGYLDYHKRIQTFLMWYVDAASFIVIDDNEWSFFTVFEKYETSEGYTQYATAAYATVYRYYAYPRNIRPRIAQILTLPPFRKLGICTKLLQTIYKHFIAIPNTVEITVEDPSSDFQSVRDYVDAKYCETLPAFQPENIAGGWKRDMSVQAQQKFKINKFQVRRVYEILRLKYLNKADKEAYTHFRLEVKNRLNIPQQRKKLEVKKLKRALTPDEFSATAGTAGERETQERLAAQYEALEEEYNRVINRMERD